MVDLSKIFAEKRASEIEWGGPLFSLYELPADVRGLRIQFVARASDLRQGIRLKIRGGKLEANGVSGSDLVIWEDASPGVVDVQVRWTSSTGRSLRVWNCWEVNGVMHAWLGNAAMRVDAPSPRVLVFRCSDGHGEPVFDDLVVRISVS